MHLSTRSAAETVTIKDHARLPSPYCFLTSRRACEMGLATENPAFDNQVAVVGLDPDWVGIDTGIKFGGDILL